MSYDCGSCYLPVALVRALLPSCVERDEVNRERRTNDHTSSGFQRRLDGIKALCLGFQCILVDVLIAGRFKVTLV